MYHSSPYHLDCFVAPCPVRIKYVKDTCIFEVDMDEIKKRAEAGHAYAQFELGQYFEFGKAGAVQDFLQAQIWYQKAADQGFAKAQYNLAMLYQHGRGVPTDYEKALRYYERAAEQNDPWAINNIGFLYAHGRGVEKNPDEAIKWYRKAAIFGHFEAQYNLGARYAGGQGVAVDLIEAHYWFARSQIGCSALQRERSSKIIESLEEVMSPEAIQEAKTKLSTELGEE
jgi:TPR repeat protein